LVQDKRNNSRNLLQRRVLWMRALSHRVRPILGLVFVLVGAAILFGVHHQIEVWAVQNIPYWLQDLSVRF
jgi:cytochrome c-type biogenesis protein